MPRLTLAAAAALLASLGGAGCGRFVSVVAERVASAPDGRTWVAGSEGFAASSAAGGPLVRRDYPRSQSAESYEYFSLPAAQVVFFDGRAYLFTRPGDVLVDRGGWQKLPVRLPVGEIGDTQVDDVLLAPGDRLFLRLHAGTLLWTTREGLEKSAFEVERAPEHDYFTWLGFLGDTLHGLGFQNDRRALERRDGPGRWTTISVLPPEKQAGSLLGVVQLRGQQWMTPEDDRPERLAVVAWQGLFMIGPHGETRLVPTEALIPAPAVRAAAVSRVSGRGNALAMPADLRVAGPADAPASPTSPSYIMSLLTAPGHGPVLTISGGHTGVLELSDNGAVFTPCSNVPTMAGAIPSAEGIRLVTQDAAVIEVSGGGCRQVQEPLIGR